LAVAERHHERACSLIFSALWILHHRAGITACDLDGKNTVTVGLLLEYGRGFTDLFSIP
jgi:hypothetical protein